MNILINNYIRPTYSLVNLYKNTVVKVKELGAEILAKNCGKTKEQIMRDFDRDYWMDAKESVAYGIVDGLIEKL